MIASILLPLSPAFPEAGSGALAAPPPPPGGGNPVYFGGDNRAGYPPLNTTTSVPPKPAAMPAGLVLRASPNPFTGSVLLSFRAAGGITSVRIFSRDGRLVRRLTAGLAGENAWQVAWDGRDRRGRSVSPGLYFARVEAGGRAATLRIVRLQ
jgi:hypothetical protein